MKDLEVDYIVVGCGLAGIAFCEILEQHHHSFVVFDNASQQSSRVAAGLYNPVVLKRFTPVWKAKELLQMALPKYDILEAKLDSKLNYKLPVYRKFSSVEEQNNWFSASDKPVLTEFLSTTLIKNTNPSLNASFGFGEVQHTGRIDTTSLVSLYANYLKEKHQYLDEAFDYSVLKPSESGIDYKHIKAKYIVFAEGFGIMRNPFFNQLPLNGTKGEMLTIHAPDLKMNFILKAAVFVVPLGQDMYWVGSTYEWEDKTHTITFEARETLVEKVKKVITCDFEVVHQVAGIRPTTIDRRPLVGPHANNNRMFVLNGLGTRGVMMSHYVAEQLYKHIESQLPLDDEITIERFS